jgi:GTP-binding protein Era
VGERGGKPGPNSGVSPSQEGGFRSGVVAICGYPNAGKSTLLNVLLDHRLAIVTPKPQTTRRRTLGILTRERCQIIFVDTPGILDPRYDLQTAMMKQVRQSMADADLLLYLVDLSHPRMAPGVAAAAQEKPVIVLLNKADLIARAEDLLPEIDKLRRMGRFADFFSISARKGRGLERVLERIEALLPTGPHYYPPDQLTEHPERFFVGELIREAVFDLYRQELPYSTEIEINAFREQPGSKDLIAATVYVEAPSQKGIVIGKSGAAIKRLGRRARDAIEAFLGRPVFLELRVRVMPDWRRDQRALRRFGY